MEIDHSKTFPTPSTFPVKKRDTKYIFRTVGNKPNKMDVSRKFDVKEKTKGSNDRYRNKKETEKRNII